MSVLTAADDSTTRCHSVKLTKLHCAILTQPNIILLIVQLMSGTRYY